MTALEVWSLGCISVVFGTILTYAIILGRDQMIIQGVLNNEGELVEESSPQQQKLAWANQEEKSRLTLKVKNLGEIPVLNKNFRKKPRKMLRWSSPCSSWYFSVSQASTFTTGQDRGQDSREVIYFL